MKKKIWLIIAAALAVIALAAVILWLSADRTDTVGICYRDGGSQENAPFRDALEQALKAKGLAVIVTDADGDQAKQLDQVRQLASEKCDVLLIEPVMTDAGQELLTALDSTGLPAVLMDRQIDQTLLEKYPQISYIGTDETQSGQIQAQLLQGLPGGGDLNGDGTVCYMLLQGPQNHKDTLLRTQTFLQALSSSDVTAQQLSLCSGDWTADSGRKLTKQELAAYGKDIEVIVCGNGQMAIGAAQAITDGGRTVGTDVYLLAIDGEGETLKMIEAGMLSATVYSDPAARVKAVSETVLAKLSQEPAEYWQLLPYTAVTADNVKQYLEN